MTKPEFLAQWEYSKVAAEKRHEAGVQSAVDQHVAKIDAELRRISSLGENIEFIERSVEHAEVGQRLGRIYATRGFRVLMSHPTITIDWVE